MPTEQDMDEGELLALPSAPQSLHGISISQPGETLQCPERCLGYSVALKVSPSALGAQQQKWWIAATLERETDRQNLTFGEMAGAWGCGSPWVIFVI